MSDKQVDAYKRIEAILDEAVQRTSAVVSDAGLDEGFDGHVMLERSISTILRCDAHRAKAMADGLRAIILADFAQWQKGEAGRLIADLVKRGLPDTCEERRTLIESSGLPYVDPSEFSLPPQWGVLARR